MLLYTDVLNNELETLACAQSLANFIMDLQRVGTVNLKKNKTPLKIYFSGEIGAGKSCFIREFLRNMGIKQKIKSPTFSIIETYALEQFLYIHVDLYRLDNEEELYYLGLEEYEKDASIILIEWPEKVKSLVKPDIQINLDSLYFGEKRKISIQSISQLGEIIIQKLIN